MNTNKKWTLKSVALHLGVSNATVSNAFNRPDQLSKQRRNDILAACKELGYFGPNKAAQSLRRGTSNIVALILPDSVQYMVSDPVASSFIKGVAGVLEQHNVSLLLYSGSSDNLLDIVDFVDGFICYGNPRNSNIVEHLAQINKKIVTVDFDLADCASVNIDNQQAAFDLTNQSLKTPTEHIAIFGLRLIEQDLVCRVYDQNQLNAEKNSIAHKRLSGYLRAISQHGLAINGERIWNIPESSSEFATMAAKEALSCSPRPELIICMSDVIAIATIRQAQEQGLKIPEDIRIVGFDGTQEGQSLQPRLTTVHQNSVDKGIRAAELFLAKKRVKENIDYQILVGQSG